MNINLPPALRVPCWPWDLLYNMLNSRHGSSLVKISNQSLLSHSVMHLASPDNSGHGPSAAISANVAPPCCPQEA